MPAQETKFLPSIKDERQVMVGSGAVGPAVGGDKGFL